MRNEIAFASRGGEGINVEGSGDGAGGGEGIGEISRETVARNEDLIVQWIETNVYGSSFFRRRKQIDVGIEFKLFILERIH